MIEIEQIFSENEGKTLEFKENIKASAGIVKTVVAFANTAGGDVLPINSAMYK